MDPNAPTPPTDWHNHRSFKFVLVALAVAMLVGLGFYVWLNNNTPSDDSYSVPSVKNKVAKTEPKKEEAPKDETADWKTYTSTDYGFTLTFSDLWKGYEVKKLETDWNLDKTIPTYYFNVPTQDKNVVAGEYNSAGFASIFAVSVLTKSQWAAYQAGEGPKPSVELARNDTHVFTYSQSQDRPEDTAAIYADVKNVIKTFKLTN